MSYQINLGQWGSVFAVPSSLVEQHLKLATETSLKVILYLLYYSNKENNIDSIAKALSISEAEVKNAVEFWIDRGLLISSDGVLTPPEAQQTKSTVETTDLPEKEKPKPPTAPPRSIRPDSAFVALLLKDDESFRGLMEEAQAALDKPISSGDNATFAMLYHTYGLPCDVIALLVHYCVSVGKPNMRAIERIGHTWSDKGIYTVEQAEEEIERAASGYQAWKHISSLFGIRNVGNPTQSQIDHADRWLNSWNFSDEMLVEAYERCVNTKGEYNIRYINAILSRWYEKGIRSLDVLKESEANVKKTKPKPTKKSAFHFENDSHDISKFKSLFDE